MLVDCGCVSSNSRTSSVVPESQTAGRLGTMVNGWWCSPFRSPGWTASSLGHQTAPSARLSCRSPSQRPVSVFPFLHPTVKSPEPRALTGPAGTSAAAAAPPPAPASAGAVDPTTFISMSSDIWHHSSSTKHTFIALLLSLVRGFLGVFLLFRQVLLVRTCTNPTWPQ